MKAVAYMRCSGRGAVFGDTWDRQLTAIKGCAETQGFTIEHEFKDEAIAGKLDQEQRPAFQEMIATLLENGCRTIIVESLDRLAREYRIQESLIVYIASKGLTLISANTGENITDAMMGDPMRRALVQIQGILAELDKNMIVAKLRNARERLRSKNGKCEGRKCFGARPGESETLDYIVKNAAQGQSSDAIANSLDALKIPTRYGKRWHSGTVSKILARQGSSK
jgi:DNA invertase Pin-like site-specific DNA recombinase